MKYIYSLLVLCILTGCAAANVYTPYTKSSNDILIVGTPGVTITALDGSFVWKHGETYKTPSNYAFSSWRTEGKTLNLKTSNMGSVNMNERGKKVKIQTPYQSEPIYGVLELAEIFTPYKGKTPATRSYYIQIPQSYVQSIKGGNVSVMFESYVCKPGFYSQTATKEYTYSSWVLWISDVPL